MTFILNRVMLIIFTGYVERYRSVLHMRNGIRFCGSAHCFFRLLILLAALGGYWITKRLFVR